VCDLETTKILVNEEEAKAHTKGLSGQEREKVIVVVVIVVVVVVVLIYFSSAIG
jgi:hypothetical protein